MLKHPDGLRFSLLLACWPLLAGYNIEACSGEANIAAASSLGFVLPEIAAVFQEETGESVKLIFGSSRALVHQIIAGAPFEVFLSADPESIRILQERSLTLGHTVIYGRGRLAFFATRQFPFQTTPDLHALKDQAGFKAIRKIAIANPKTAPYGRVALEVLNSLGLWERLAGKLVFGQNAMQAARFAASGAVDAALIPYSLVTNPQLSGRGQSVMVSEQLYQALDHEMTMVRGGGSTARVFFAYLSSEKAQLFFRRNGL